uniref:hypothetical protein n=1 Tax=Streptomyces virginiae TaxID=1961 RepID=UPI002F917E26
MTSLPQPRRDHQREQFDLRIAAAKAESAHRANQKREARRTVRRLRRARRAHLHQLRRIRGAAYVRSMVTVCASPSVGLAGLGTAVFTVAIMMFIQGNVQAADMLSVAVGFWTLALMVRRRK